MLGCVARPCFVEYNEYGSEYVSREDGYLVDRCAIVDASHVDTDHRDSDMTFFLGTW